MSEQLLQEIRAELAEMKAILSAISAEIWPPESSSQIVAEINSAEAMGISPADYLKIRAKERRDEERKAAKKNQSGSPKKRKTARKRNPHNPTA